METIYFKNSHGQKICGALSDPKADSVVLICHGLGTSKNDATYTKLQEKINAQGIATFRIDMLGHGDSDGQYEDLTLTEAIDDILQAREFLLKRGFKNIGFIGSSFGAVGGLMAASIEEFSFLVLISPPTYYDIPEMVSSGISILRELRRFKKGQSDDRKASIKIRFFRDYGSHDSYNAASKIKCPALIIQGGEDKIVPLVKTRQLHKHLKNSKMKIFKGVGHHYSEPGAEKRLIEEVMLFIMNENR
jgi:hypothetical protein